jgi:hypothetical protein
VNPQCWAYSSQPRVNRGLSASASATTADMLSGMSTRNTPPKRPRCLTPGDQRVQGLGEGQRHEHVPQVHRGEDQRVDDPAAARRRIVQQAQLAEVDLALLPRLARRPPAPSRRRPTGGHGTKPLCPRQPLPASLAQRRTQHGGDPPYRASGDQPTVCGAVVAVVAGGGGLGAAFDEAQFGAVGEVEGGGCGCAADEPVAVRVVEVAGVLAVLSNVRQVAFGVPGEGLAGAGNGAAGGVAGLVVVVAVGGGAVGYGAGGSGQRVGLGAAGGRVGVGGGVSGRAVAGLGEPVASGVRLCLPFGRGLPCERKRALAVLCGGPWVYRGNSIGH